MPQRTRAWLPWLLTAVALSSLSSSEALVTVVLQPQDGQRFADAVAAFGTTGQDTLLLLPRGQVLSLANVTIKDANSTGGRLPFSSGTLTIRPGPGSSTAPTILDTAMLHGLASFRVNPRALSGSARIVVEDIIIVNMCDSWFPIDFSTNTGWYSAFSPAFVPGSAVYAGISFTNVTWYTRQADLTSWVAALLSYFSPFPELANKVISAGADAASLIRVSAAPSLFSAYGFSVLSMSVPGWQATSFSVLSTGNPNDPVLQFLRSRNLLLPHRICTPRNGPPISALPLQIEPYGPLWLATDTAGFLNSLSQATIDDTAPSPLFFHASILVSGIINPAGQVVFPDIAPLNQTLVITGNIVLESATHVEGILDLTGMTRPLLTVKQSGGVFMQYMRIRGLPTSPLPGAGTPSVFPLSSFVSDTAGRNAVVRQHNVTLELPDYDYLALLALAQPALTAALNATALSHLAALRAGIQSFAVRSVGPARLHASSFQGWGINTSSVFFEPANPALSLDILRLQQSLSSNAPPAVAPSQPTSQGISGGQLAGVIVGTLIGGLIIGVLATLAAIRVHQARRGAQYAADRAGKEEEAGMRGGCTAGVACSRLGSDEHTGGTGAPARVLPASVVMNAPTDASQGVSKAVTGAAEPQPSASLSVALTVKTLDRALATQSTDAATGTGGKGASTASSDIATSQADSPFHWARPPSEHPNSALVATKALCAKLVQRLSVNGTGGRPLAPRPSHLNRREVQELQSFVGEHAVLKETGTAAGSAADASEKLTLALAARTSNNERPESMHRQSIGTKDHGRVSPAAAADGSKALSGSTAAASGASGSRQLSSLRAFQRAITGSSSAESTHPKAMVNMLVEEMAGDMHKVEVTGVLGQGSWGRVYSGRWRGLHVALKTMTFEVIQDDQDEFTLGSTSKRNAYKQQQAILEAAVSATVDHPNIVRTYYYDIKAIETARSQVSSGLHIDDATHQAKGARLQTYKLFLVQELCAMPLSALFEKSILNNGPEGHATTLLLLLDIASGLEYLHSRNIVHGDLKPANILLSPSDASPSGVVAKLADFGLSARLGGDATHVSNYNSGTPFYVAPEVVHEHRASPASDIFALGVVLWQLYCGMLPYSVSPDGHFSWNELFPRYADPQPPYNYMALTQRCLQRSPKDRPTATDVICVLRSIYTEVHGDPWVPGVPDALQGDASHQDTTTGQQPL